MKPATNIERASAEPGAVVYEKARAKLTDNEKSCVDHLVGNGVSVIVKAENPHAPANIDLEIDGQLWEMKNVTNKSSVSNQIKRARVKWLKLSLAAPVCIVFSTEGATASFDEICDALKSRKREGEEFMVITAQGDITAL